METDYQTNMTPRFHLCAENQIQEIHRASLNILEKTGVKVESEEAIALLRDAGASAGKDGIVHIPSHIVEEAISTAPRSVTIYHPDRKGEMVLEGNRIYYGSGSDCPFTYVTWRPGRNGGQGNRIRRTSQSWLTTRRISIL